MNAKLFFLLAVALFSTAVFAVEGSVIVLCYHTFIGNPSISTDFSKEELEEHIKILQDKGYSFVSFSDIANGTVKGENNILISIDDDHSSIYPVVMEVLLPKGIKPLLSIYPCAIDKPPRYLTWNQINEMLSKGAEIASHGYFHYHLNQKLYEKDSTDFLREVRTSKRVIERRTEKEIEIFTYPNGVYDNFAIKRLKIEGYSWAFTINNGRVKVPLKENSSPYLLPRYMLVRSNYQRIFNSF